MRIKAPDANNNEIITTANFTNKRQAIVFADYEYVFNVYTYDDKNGKIPPFVNFNNDGLCLYSNLKNTRYEDLSSYGQELLAFYAYHLRLSNYTDRLRTIDLAGGTKKINWKIGNLTSAEFSPSNRELDILTDGKHSHFQIMTQIKRELDEQKLLDLISSTAQKMHLNDKIKYAFIKDPKDRDWTSSNLVEDAPVTVGVMGSSYLTNQQSSSVVSNTQGKNKCVVSFSPFIYYMTPENQKILIVHELAHIKVGNEHRHDSYFWKTFERFSGLSKEADWSYDYAQELSDNNTYDSYHAKGDTVQDLIDKTDKIFRAK